MTEGMSSWPFETCLLELYVTLSLTLGLKLSTTSPTTLPTVSGSMSLDMSQREREREISLCFAEVCVMEFTIDIELFIDKKKEGMGRGGALAKTRSLKRFGNTSTFYKMISVQYR